MVQCTSARKGGSWYLVLVPFLARKMLCLRDAARQGTLQTKILKSKKDCRSNLDC